MTSGKFALPNKASDAEAAEQCFEPIPALCFTFVGMLNIANLEDSSVRGWV